MTTDPYFISKCIALESGESANNHASNYTIHKYDTWMALWHHPKPGNLGREFVTEAELVAFLKGNATIGKVIQKAGGN